MLTVHHLLAFLVIAVCVLSALVALIAYRRRGNAGGLVAHALAFDRFGNVMLTAGETNLALQADAGEQLPRAPAGGRSGLTAMLAVMRDFDLCDEYNAYWPLFDSNDDAIAMAISTLHNIAQSPRPPSSPTAASLRLPRLRRAP